MKRKRQNDLDEDAEFFCGEPAGCFSHGNDKIINECVASLKSLDINPALDIFDTVENGPVILLQGIERCLQNAKRSQLQDVISEQNFPIVHCSRAAIATANHAFNYNMDDNECVSVLNAWQLIYALWSFGIQLNHHSPRLHKCSIRINKPILVVRKWDVLLSGIFFPNMNIKHNAKCIFCEKCQRLMDLESFKLHGHGIRFQRNVGSRAKIEVFDDSKDYCSTFMKSSITTVFDKNKEQNGPFVNSESLNYLRTEQITSSSAQPLEPRHIPNLQEESSEKRDEASSMNTFLNSVCFSKYFSASNYLFNRHSIRFIEDFYSCWLLIVPLNLLDFIVNRRQQMRWVPEQSHLLKAINLEFPRKKAF